MIAAPASILLRGFPLSMADELWDWLNSPRFPNFDDFSDQTFQHFKSTLATRILGEDTFAIVDGDKIIGYIGYKLHSPVTAHMRGLVIAPGFRRQGHGLRAVNAMVEDMTRRGAKKITCDVFADNLPIKVLLEQAGFVQEGYITKAVQRGGEMVDTRIMCYPGVAGAVEED